MQGKVLQRPSGEARSGCQVENWQLRWVHTQPPSQQTRQDCHARSQEPLQLKGLEREPLEERLEELHRQEDLVPDPDRQLRDVIECLEKELKEQLGQGVEGKAVHAVPMTQLGEVQLGEGLHTVYGMEHGAERIGEGAAEQLEEGVEGEGLHTVQKEQFGDELGEE